MRYADLGKGNITKDTGLIYAKMCRTKEESICYECHGLVGFLVLDDVNVGS